MSLASPVEDASGRAPLGLRPLGEEEVLNGDWLLSEFLSFVEKSGLVLYPAQEEAILEITQGNNVILNTPTGSGKSLVGLSACFAALAYGDRAFYTAPIKALVGEKFLELCRVFGPWNVGMMTGDATVNHDAPVICCTAEILSNLALREGKAADVAWVVMDEFHYYSDRDRGVAWQVPLLTLPQARFVLMSATLGETAFFEQALTELTGAPTVLVKSEQRPVPLDFAYSEKPLLETLQDLLEQQRVPVYLVHFSQRAASEEAQRLTSLNFLDKDQKLAIKEQLSGFKFDTAFGKELARFIPHGIGVHHAGMLPKYRLLVERLAQKGLLKIICGTDTLGVGVNIPLRTVLFTQLCKFDGAKVKILKVRDFHQIAGRAGRRGFDTEGSVVVQAPEHVVENLAMKRKAAGDAKKLKKLRPKKEPERGYAPWDRTTMEHLRTSVPEPLSSRFEVTSGMLLNVLCRRQENGCVAMKRLLRACHETKERKRLHARSAIVLFRALAEAEILQLTEDGVRVHTDLQEDFSLNHALSLYAVSVVESLDREDRDYSLVVLTVVESILEDPGVLLLRQVDTLKTRKMAELKHAGVGYEERLTELEKVTYPKPDEEMLLGTYEVFTQAHPWVLGHHLRPKSIARDMYELGLSFRAYVKEYGLARAEGVLLRYLSEVYRALSHTIPETARTPEVSDIIEWLEVELKRIDSSLLDEWNRLSDPERFLSAPSAQPEQGIDITRDKRAFTVLIRNAVWRVVCTLSRRDFAQAEEILISLGTPRGAALAATLEAQLESYFAEYSEIRTDPRARSPAYLEVTEGQKTWQVRQILVDPEEDLAWSLLFEVDLTACKDADRLVLRFLDISSA